MKTSPLIEFITALADGLSPREIDNLEANLLELFKNARSRDKTYGSNWEDTNFLVGNFLLDHEKDSTYDTIRTHDSFRIFKKEN